MDGLKILFPDLVCNVMLLDIVTKALAASAHFDF